MACGCSTPTCNNCTPTVQLTNCAGCTYTTNTDCVIYKDDVLSFESPSTKDGSARTLTDLLQLISDANCCQRESNIVTGDYTIVPEDTSKIILLKGFDDGVVGTITYTLTLPETLDFANKELIFKDISKPIDSGVTTIAWRFNIAIQYSWNPLTTTNNYVTLQTGTHKTLKLRFIKTTDASYQWIVV